MPADARGGLRHVESDRVRDRLAGVDGLDETQLARVGVDQVGPGQQDALAGAWIHPRPHAPVGSRSCCRDSDLHVGHTALGHIRDRLARGRVLGHEPATVHGGSEIAADEQVGAEAEPGNLGGRLLAVGDQRVGHDGRPRLRDR